MEGINNNRISISSVLLAFYFAITPIHQMLLLNNGSTINKYLSIVIIIAILIKQSKDKIGLTIHTQITKEVFCIILYIVISFIWSISWDAWFYWGSSIISFMVFTLFVCTIPWTNKEKKLFMIVIALSCTFYSITIANTETLGRSFLSGINEKATDPNMLAANIAFGIVICLRYYFVSKKPFLRWISLICMFVMIYGVLATGSRGGLIASVAGMVYVLVKNKISINQLFRMIIVLLLVSFGIMLLLSGKTSINDYVLDRFIKPELVEGANGRNQIWGQYIEVLFGQIYYFFIGTGFGNAGYGYAKHFSTIWMPSTHNDILELLCEGGLILVILVFFLVKKVWRVSRNQNNIIGNAALIVSIVAGLSLNCFIKYIWWNSIILAYIGVDCFSDAEEVE